jgi:poly-gamma-glutamate synthase PgsB/CapB
MMVLPLVGIVSVGLYLVWLVRRKERYDRELRLCFRQRIHVNGIRGKSSVTRLIAAALRGGGYTTLAKTTGTAARIILDDSTEYSVERLEPNINEQVALIKRYLWTDREALVLECMAINPVYQTYLENKVIQSHIGVITNVREDHTDQMGETLARIARSLAGTIPHSGHLVTAEKDPKILAIFQKVCVKRGTILHQARRETKVFKKDMLGFSHIEFEDNVAISLVVAKLLGIKRADALRAMQRAAPDPGTLSLKTATLNKKVIHFANLFAVNDKESFIVAVRKVEHILGGKKHMAVVLNNRSDRPDRVDQFFNIACDDLHADQLFTLGDYEAHIKFLAFGKNDKPDIHHIGHSTKYRNASGAELLRAIAEKVKSDTLVIGAVNVHTDQAERLLNHIGKRKGHEIT